MIIVSSTSSAEQERKQDSRELAGLAIAETRLHSCLICFKTTIFKMSTNNQPAGKQM